MTDQTFEEQVELSSLDNIQADGISIRVNGQIIKFVASEVQDIGVEEEIKRELTDKYEVEVASLTDQYNSLVGSLKSNFKSRNRELDKRENELDKKAREIVSLPIIREEDTVTGLSVSVRSRTSGGFLWSFITVYSPKYVNKSVIDPVFGKRLMTPIRIFIFTDNNWKITEVRLVKLINCDKFAHYHVTGSSDCWGGMKFSGLDVSTSEKALTVIRDVRLVLESINRGSIGNRAPKGLPRLATLEKHLKNERTDPENDKRDKTTASRRNDRVGYGSEENEALSDELWSTA